MVSADDSPEADEPFRLRRWRSTLTYEELHAAGIGAALFGLAATAASEALLAAALAVLLWAWGIRASPYRDTRTGARKASFPAADDVADDAADGESVGIVAKYLAQIRNEALYFTVGGFAGDGVGRLAHLWFFGSWPDHYEALPRLIETLAPMPAIVPIA